MSKRFLAASALFAILAQSAFAADINGQVTEKVTGDPVAGVIITIGDSPTSYNTDASGHFTIPGVSGDSVTLTFHRAGYYEDPQAETRKPTDAWNIKMLSIKNLEDTNLQKAVITQFKATPSADSLKFAEYVAGSTLSAATKVSVTKDLIKSTSIKPTAAIEPYTLTDASTVAAFATKVQQAANQATTATGAGTVPPNTANLPEPILADIIRDLNVPNDSAGRIKDAFQAKAAVAWKMNRTNGQPGRIQIEKPIENATPQ